MFLVGLFICSSLSPPECDILKSDKRAAIGNGVVGGTRSGEAFTAAREKISISDFIEELVLVNVDGSVDGC